MKLKIIDLISKSSGKMANINMKYANYEQIVADKKVIDRINFGLRKSLYVPERFNCKEEGLLICMGIDIGIGLPKIRFISVGEIKKQKKGCKTKKEYTNKLQKYLRNEYDIYVHYLDVESILNMNSYSFKIGEIDADRFANIFKNKYTLVKEMFEKHFANSNGNFDIKIFADTINELISIPNMIQLLRENKGLSAIKDIRPDVGPLLKNKKYIISIYGDSSERKKVLTSKENASVIYAQKWVNKIIKMLVSCKEVFLITEINEDTGVGIVLLIADITKALGLTLNVIIKTPKKLQIDKKTEVELSRIKKKADVFCIL